ncbi:MAG: aminotransferase class V-fold PLP-dependent enzyme [Gemmatimonadota bacterium]
MSETPPQPAIDVTALRADTPGLEHRVHLNSAGASLMPQPVLEAIQGHIDLEGRIGGYEAEAEAAPAIGAAYSAVGRLIAAPADRVAMTEHATMSFVSALSCIPFAAGDVLVTTEHDYVSNQIQYLALAHRFGVEVVRVPDAPEGGVDLQAMEETIHRRRPKLVAVTHIPTNSGLIQDVASIGTMCRARGIWYLVDGCQSVGQIPVDVGEIGCDFFSATSRKWLRGPRGAGFLYVSDRVLDAGLEPLFPDMRSADWIADDLYQPAPDARRFESWEFSWALVLGTGAAAEYALQVGVDEGSARALALAASLRERLAAVPGASVLDQGARLGAIVTASFSGFDPAHLVASLRDRGINTSSQTRIDAVIDYDRKGVDGALRMSPHYFNETADLDELVDALTEIVS